MVLADKLDEEINECCTEALENLASIFGAVNVPDPTKDGESEEDYWIIDSVCKAMYQISSIQRKLGEKLM